MISRVYSGYRLRGPDFLGGLLVGEGGSQRAGILTYRQNEKCGWCLNLMSTSSLTVPFTSHMDAGLARYFLTARTQLRGPIRKELDVNGRMLVL